MSETANPWGALPYYQIHFVVVADVKGNEERFIARTMKKTSGIINKRVIDTWWIGAGVLAEKLNQDSNLKSLLKDILLEEDEIRIEGVEECIRIHGGWKIEGQMDLSKKALEAYGLIASHVKQLLYEIEVTH